MRVKLKRKQQHPAELVDGIREDNVESRDDDADDWHVEPVADEDGAFMGFFIVPIERDAPEEPPQRPRRRRRT